MEFPRFVFISPGPTKCQGGTYDSELVKDKTEYDAAIKGGFSPSIPDALAAKAKVKLEPKLKGAQDAL